MSSLVPIGITDLRSVIRDKEVARVRDCSREDLNGAVVDAIILLIEEIVPAKPVLAAIYENDNTIGAIAIKDLVAPEDIGVFDGKTLVKDAARARWRGDFSRVINELLPPDNPDRWKHARRVTIFALPG